MSSNYTCDICLEEFVTHSQAMKNYNVCTACLKDTLMNTTSLNPFKKSPIDVETLLQCITFEEFKQICVKQFLEIRNRKESWYKAMMEKINDEIIITKDEVAKFILTYTKLRAIRPHFTPSTIEFQSERMKKDLERFKSKLLSLFRDIKVSELDQWIAEYENVSSTLIMLSKVYPMIINLKFNFKELGIDIKDEFATPVSEREVSALEEIYAKNKIKKSDLKSHYYKKAINNSIYKNENLGRCRCNLGVISSADYSCNVCKRKACPTCLNFEHPDTPCTVDDMKLIHYYKTKCQSCPECGIWIEKSQGCDDMFCTFCHTTFNFVDRKKIYGNIHNPHRMDYLSSINTEDTSFDLNFNNVYWAMDIIYELVNPDSGYDLYERVHSLFYHFTTLAALNVERLTKKYNNFKKTKIDFSFGGLVDLEAAHFVFADELIHEFIDFNNPISEAETKIRNSLIIDSYLHPEDIENIAMMYMMLIVWNQKDEKRKALIETGETIFKISQKILEYRIKQDLFILDEEDTEPSLSDHEEKLLSSILDSYLDDV